MTEREKIIKIIAPYVAAYGEDEAIADPSSMIVFMTVAGGGTDEHF